MALKQGKGYSDGPNRSTSIYSQKNPMKSAPVPVQKEDVTPPTGSLQNPIQPAEEPADYGKIVAAEEAADEKS